MKELLLLTATTPISATVEGAAAIQVYCIKLLSSVSFSRHPQYTLLSNKK